MLGFLFVILLVIPITVFLVQQQQEIRTRAAKTTTLSFEPPEKEATVGAKLDFEIWVSPGENVVSAIKLAIKWDATKLKATEDSFVLDRASNLSIVERPVISPSGDELVVTLDIQQDITKLIQKDTKIADITFDVIASSETPTEISFVNDKVDIRSQATTDEFDENVYLNGTPATVTFQEAPTTPTPGGATATPTPITSPTPISSESADGLSPSDNESPVCESLITDGSTSGTAPMTLTFTANGSDSDGTVDKVTFSYGDGTVEDVTSGGGIGTDSVSVSQAFTYQSANTYTASALLTDDNGAVSSDSTDCAVTITVSGGSGSESAEVTPLEPTGPTESIFGLGALGAVLFIIGALFFFAL